MRPWLSSGAVYKRGADWFNRRVASSSVVF